MNFPRPCKHALEDVICRQPMQCKQFTLSCKLSTIEVLVDLNETNKQECVEQGCTADCPVNEQTNASIELLTRDLVNNLTPEAQTEYNLIGETLYNEPGRLVEWLYRKILEVDVS